MKRVITSQRRLARLPNTAPQSVQQQQVNGGGGANSSNQGSQVIPVYFQSNNVSQTRSREVSPLAQKVNEIMQQTITTHNYAKQRSHSVQNLQEGAPLHSTARLLRLYREKREYKHIGQTLEQYYRRFFGESLTQNSSAVAPQRSGGAQNNHAAGTLMAVNLQVDHRRLRSAVESPVGGAQQARKVILSQKIRSSSNGHHIIEKKIPTSGEGKSNFSPMDWPLLESNVHAPHVSTQRSDTQMENDRI